MIEIVLEWYPDEERKPKPKRAKGPRYKKSFAVEVEELGRAGWGVEAVRVYLGLSDARFRQFERERPEFFKAATYARTNDIRSRLYAKQRKRTEALIRQLGADKQMELIRAALAARREAREAEAAAKERGSAPN